jgi:hypothetical protein
MSLNTITAANATYTITILGLFPTPQQIQGFATDSAFDTESAEMAEVMKGVDGRMSAGWVPFITQQGVALQADSPSMFIFDQWINIQKVNREIYPASAIISMPSIKVKFTLTNGVLRTGPQIPGTRKVLQPRTFQLSWDDITPAPML